LPESFRSRGDLVPDASEFGMRDYDDIPKHTTSSTFILPPVPFDHRLTAPAVPQSFDVPLRITSRVRPFETDRIVSKSILYARKPCADPSDLLR
jgi:hypothetical protein